ncbi:unnamed protein product [Didymodactylos carnosus]|uniref:Uncharacterized protein n=1 Tax=Didymodactylos carnosus TaxID=1234261 RepID=A0A815FFV7_9BILA|nr:unnamed protein product [Didymodactylos carnosus]CAF4170562.1 unnamed protein product [Didymodactylos carnosus]
MEKSKKTGCSKFVAQEWNANKCRECFRAKQVHEHQSVATSNDYQVPINRRPLSVRHLSSNDTPANNYSSKTTFREQRVMEDERSEWIDYEGEVAPTARRFEDDYEGGAERVFEEESPIRIKNGVTKESGLEVMYGE